MAQSPPSPMAAASTTSTKRPRRTAQPHLFTASAWIQTPQSTGDSRARHTDQRGTTPVWESELVIDTTSLGAFVLGSSAPIAVAHLRSAPAKCDAATQFQH